MNARLPLLAAALFGASGVVAGAFGAHALRPGLIERGMLDAWETGVHYQLLHAVALVGLAAWLRGVASPAVLRQAGWAVGCWAAGITLFAGSLYLIAVGGPRWLGPITPIGGVALVAGWLWVAAVAWAS